MATKRSNSRYLITPTRSSFAASFDEAYDFGRRANRGIPANALFAFMQHAESFNAISRRSRMVKGMANSPERLRLFYGLTPSGGYIVKILEVLTDVSRLSEGLRAGGRAECD